jgi:glycosyltransferase involved in cell wall biosynthesis
MLSIIITTENSERSLVPTLAALVPGATAGLVREVIIADAGSRDATAEVADIAGCVLLVSDAPLAERLGQAAEAARGSWLLFLTAGTVLQPGWIEEVSRFIDDAALAGRTGAMAGVFRAVSPRLVRASPWREAVTLLAQAVRLRRPDGHGLLIEKQHYRCVAESAAGVRPLDPDVIRRMVRRVGRRSIVTLRCGAVAG